jgi:choline kinase
MKLLILAAGQGKRLRPLTNNKPKCMVEYRNKPIIDYILEATESIEDKYIVCGYKDEVLREYLKDKNIKFLKNELYDTTNMVYSMLCANTIFSDSLIVSYSDIIYPKSFVDKLLKSKSDVSIVADINWFELWSKRFDNVLEDCETFKYDKSLNIYEIGQKSTKISDTMAGYVGLIKFSKKVLDYIIKLKLDNNMYMTDLLQLLIKIKKFEVKAILVNKPWLEIDSLKDIDVNL